jgi:type VI secretion system secreted protein VgrG
MAREPHSPPFASKYLALAITFGLVLTAIVLPAEKSSSIGISPSAVLLGSASTFSVLAATTSTNAATAAGSTPTHLSGDLGVYPGTSLTGFAAVDSGPGIVDGVVDASPYSRSATAQSDAVTAYLDAQRRASTILSGSTFQLGGHTYSPGVYSAGSSMGITGTLTLDGGGDPNAVFIFQAGSTLVTAAGSPSTPASTIALTNGTQAANVFWQVGSSATLGTYSSFSGTILALTSITATTGASIDGRLIALNAAVTLDSNNIATSPADATAPTLTITGGPTVTTTDTTPTITGTSDEIGGTVTVTITDESTHTLTAIVDDNGDWSVTIADPTEGPHTVTANVNDPAGNSATATEELMVNAPRTGGGSSGSSSNSAPTIWASGASPVASPPRATTVDEIRILATTQFHGATWWLAPDSLGEEREHELIPDGDEIHAAHHIPRGAK